MVRAVLFDLDDTLFDHAGCARDALTAVQACHPALSALSLEALESQHAALLEQLHADVMLGRVPIEVARRERFRRLLAACGADAPDDLARDLAATYRDAYREARRAVAGAAALLSALRDHGARLGIVSNNLLDEQREKLRTCALESFVDALVVSEEVGVSKPDAEIFRVALDRLECVPAHAVMIGDSWDADIVGARAAGIRAVWFNPVGATPPDTVADIPQLRSLEPVSRAMRIIFDAHRH
jgi:HAD superfamily hydrolase (TIGR01549 family)